MAWNYIGVCVIQQQSNRNFVSPHSHVISSINFLVKHKTSNVTLKKYIIRTQTGSPSYLAWYSLFAGLTMQVVRLSVNIIYDGSFYQGGLEKVTSCWR